MVDFICCKKTLKEWCTYPLAKRVVLFKRQFGVKISPATLSNYYKKNGIKYLRSRYFWTTKVDDEE